MKKKLIGLFLIIVIIKIILTIFITSPSIFADEYVYLKGARSFFTEGSFNIYDGHKSSYPPLYYIIISISYLLKDATLIYLTIKIINALIISAIIFPSYLLAKEFLEQKDALVTAILISLLPANFGFNNYIMSENIYYLLFLIYIYLFYKALKTNEKKYYLFTGIIIGLSLLTRSVSSIMILITIVTVIINNLKKRNIIQIKNTILALLITSIIYIPYSMTKQSLFPGYEVVLQNNSPTIIAVTSFFIWSIFYTAIIILSTGIIGSIPIIPKIKEIKEKHPLMANLFYTTIILTVFLVAYYALTTNVKAESILSFLKGRPIGRYIDYILPLIVIMTIIAAKLKPIITLKQSALVYFILVLSTPIVFFQLFPLNNISTSWIGTIRFMLGKQTIPITIMIFSVIYLIMVSIAHKITNKQKVISFLFIFFITINILNFSLIYQNSKIWSNSEQFKLGKWINNNIQEQTTFLIDQDSCTSADFKNSDASLGPPPFCKWTKVGIWINNKLIVDKVNTAKPHEYIITKQKLDKILIKNFGTTYLYKN